jgi:hypothetical protein
MCLVLYRDTRLLCFVSIYSNNCAFEFSKLQLLNYYVVIFSELRFRMKTLDREVLTTATRCVITLLGASSWSSDFVRSCVDVDMSLVASFGFHILFYLFLLCFVRGSPYHLISIRLLWLYL